MNEIAVVDKARIAPAEVPGPFEELNPGSLSLPQLQPNPSSSRSMAPALPGTPLDSVSSPITRLVYNLYLDEFFEWYGREPRPGFTEATVAAWRAALDDHLSER